MPQASFWGSGNKQPDPKDDFDPEHDYYKDLGLTKSAKKEDIKNAYYKLCYEYHPDKSSGMHQDKFKMINVAYDVLKDQEKKERYDQAR